MMRSRKLLLFGGVLAITAAIIAVLGILPSRSVSANPLGGLTMLSPSEDQTCALNDSGDVLCWGYRQAPLPTAIPNLGQPVLALGGGYSQQCAILGDGSVTCWWYESRVRFSSSYSFSSSAIAVSAGTFHTCALLQDGTVSCWGENPNGQLGLAQEYCTPWTPCIHDPTIVEGVDDVVALAAGGAHNCAVRDDGTVSCWGSNTAGQLGNGSGVDSATPVTVLGINDAVDTAAGQSFSCALRANGSVACWGLGYGNEAVDAPGLGNGVRAVRGGWEHACALMTDSTVQCWGSNGVGQLGDGQHCGLVCRNPVAAAGLENVSAIATGTHHTCALLDSGTAKCWGMNYVGQLGNGTTGSLAVSTLPIDVVQSDVKPTPTPTPCGGVGCPSPTPPPLPPMTGLDFSIAIDRDDDGMADCGTRLGQEAYCEMEIGAPFHVLVDLNAYPVGVSTFEAFDAAIAFDGISTQQKSDVTWPDCGFPATYYANDFLAFACTVPVGDVVSSYVGTLGKSLFECTRSGSVTLRHGRGNTGLVWGSQFRTSHESGPDETINITCGDPISGDVDCSVAVTSVDAQLTLQEVGGVLDSVPCPQLADVNLDRGHNAIDSLITLQYTAGLVPSLPVFPEGG